MGDSISAIQQGISQQSLRSYSFNLCQSLVSSPPLRSSAMAGPKLEFFRFATYVFFPILVMAHYGDPDWYHRYIYPLRDAYLQPEKADVKLSETQDELKRQLAELKEARLAKRAARLGQQENEPEQKQWRQEGQAELQQQEQQPHRLV